MSFTVVSYCSQDFAIFVEPLRDDCRRHGYDCHIDLLGHNFDNLIEAFDYKIEFLKTMVRRFGTVLWLDIECRIVRPIPSDWLPPLITDYEIAGSPGLSSGVLMLSERHADLLEIWSRYALKYPASPDDFVLDFLRRRDRVAIDTIPMVFYDRAAPVPVVRGEWRNAHTVIQHPSINRWPKPARYRDAFCGSSKRDVAATTRQRKHLFFRNFGGEFARVEQWMRQGDGRLCESAWVFDAVSGRYAPELFWESHPDEYFCKPRRLEDSWRGFEQEPRGGRYRDRAIKRMKLDAADGGATWWRRWWAASTPVERNSDAGA